jgi:hypothetical protein
VLFWHLLPREQDAFDRPSLTRHKLRRLKLIPAIRGQRSASKAGKRKRRHERELSEQIEQAYRRLAADSEEQVSHGRQGSTPRRLGGFHLGAARSCLWRELFSVANGP